jgi:hypothetical protein
MAAPMRIHARVLLPFLPMAFDLPPALRRGDDALREGEAP